MSILIFFLILFVLVLVHEFGHFVVAKKTGMRVDEFGIGFPPKLFSVKKGETEYSFNVFPIGGFVKILGENLEDMHDDMDSNRSFSSKGKWQQAAVLVAGVTMNILFAWLLFVIVFTVGTQTLVTEEDATDSARLVITEVLPESPAFEAGLVRNTVITELSSGDEFISDLSPTTFREFTSIHNDEEIKITYEQDGKEMQVSVTPIAGLIEEDQERPAIGIALGFVELVSKPLHKALYEGLILTLTSLRDITVGISVLLYNALTFQADFSQVAGPIGIVGLVGEASEFGITTLLMFTAFISLNLAVINLLPFPALDGGRLLFVGIEAIKKSPINPLWVGRLNAVGFLLLILLMVAVTYNDILRLI